MDKNTALLKANIEYRPTLVKICFHKGFQKQTCVTKCVKIRTKEYELNRKQAKYKYLILYWFTQTKLRPVLLYVGFTNQNLITNKYFVLSLLTTTVFFRPFLAQP